MKSISTTCIPNYPDRNLPTVFVYLDGNIINQFIGHDFNNNLSLEGFYNYLFRITSWSFVVIYIIISLIELEWMLGQTGAIDTNIKENPRPKVKDVLFSQLSSDANDW